MNDRLLADLLWLAQQIRTDGPAYRGASIRGREDMAKKLAVLCVELDENIRYNRAPLPRDWSAK